MKEHPIERCLEGSRQRSLAGARRTIQEDDRAGHLQVETALRAGFGADGCMGSVAEVATSLRVGGEVTPEGAVVQELDELAAARAPDCRTPKLGAGHASKLGAAGRSR
jgi:hypothetical protein